MVDNYETLRLLNTLWLIITIPEDYLIHYGLLIINVCSYIVKYILKSRREMYRKVDDIKVLLHSDPTDHFPSRQFSFQC